MDAIRSFSGAHSFRPACLKAALELERPGSAAESVVAALEDLVWEIDRGFCPRCREQAFEQQFPAGSRITRCRCVPICHLCGEHEVVVGLGETTLFNQPVEAGSIYGPWTWYEDNPFDLDEMRAEVEKYKAKGRKGEAILSDDTMVTEEGAFTVVPRPGAGGWFELGDEGDDEDERRGR